MDSYSDEAKPDEGCELPQPRFAMNEEIAASYVDFLAKYPRNKQICLCGHSINSHNFSVSIGYVCQSANIWCCCKKPIPAYFASDARVFKRSTHGSGGRHALGLGIASLHAKGGTGEWIMDLKCVVSGCAGTELTVVCLDKGNTIVPKSTEISVLLCKEHFDEFGGWRL